MKIPNGRTPTMCWPTTRRSHANGHRVCVDRAMPVHSITTARTSVAVHANSNIGKSDVCFPVSDWIFYRFIYRDMFYCFVIGGQVDTMPKCQAQRRMGRASQLRCRRQLSILPHTNGATISSGNIQIDQMQWCATGRLLSTQRILCICTRRT